LLLSDVVPVHVVAARLGHADPAITLRVYAHVIRSAEAAAADSFAQAVMAASKVAVANPLSGANSFSERGLDGPSRW